MQLKFLTDPQFTTRAVVALPGVEAQDFDVTFRVLPEEEMDAFDETVDGYKSMLRAVVVGLGDIEDEKGNPVPFSDGLLENMLSRQPFRMALLKAYTQGLYGARAKN